MPRPPKWNSETAAIRLPKHAIEACLKLAAALDAPPPDTPTADPEVITQQQRHLNFVQNQCGRTTLVTLLDGSQERQYLIQPQPLDFEDYQALEEAIAYLERRMREEGLTRPQDRLLLFSQLVEKTCKQRPN